MRVNILWIALASWVIGSAAAQDSAANQPLERWNLYYQATSIGDYHGNFPALYSGAHSLQNTWERDASLTSTLYLGLRLPDDTQIYIDPELAGGRGFSGVNGVANAPNGELPRVASATPSPISPEHTSSTISDSEASAKKLIVTRISSPAHAR